MPSGSHSKLLLAAGVAAIGLIVAAVMFWPGKPAQPVAATRPAPPATLPVAATTTAPAGPQSLLDLVRLDHPFYDLSEPLATRLQLAESAHLVLAGPVYFDNQTPGHSDLWITRDDAPATDVVLDQAREKPWRRTSRDRTPAKPIPHVHFTREHVIGVTWIEETGVFRPVLFCRNGDQPPFMLDGSRRFSLGPNASRFDWSRAFYWRDERKLILPTVDGVSIVNVTPAGFEEISSGPLADAGKAHAPPRFCFYFHDLIAWVPPDATHEGAPGAARFSDGKWIRMTAEQGWPAGLLHLIAFTDGSILQIIREGSDAVRLAYVQPLAQKVDEKTILDLIDALSDLQSSVRDNATNELARIGPGAWALLERELATLPASEASDRIHALLKNKMVPTLGQKTLLDPKLQYLATLPDTGALFFAPAGVSVPQPGREQPANFIPAWLSIRPVANFVEILPQSLVRDLRPGVSRITVRDEQWIVSDELRGPLLHTGNALVPLVRKGEERFDEFLGIDHDGRWIFRESAGDDLAHRRTLVIDPYLPDPHPHLPVCLGPNKCQAVGWTRDGWPVIKNTGAWALMEAGWRPLDEQTEKMITTVDVPATSPANAQTPILVDARRNRYFDGRLSLQVERPDHTRIEWPLPGPAAGAGQAHLIEAKDGILYLFNAPGRVLRIRPTFGRAEPFILEATFTHNIPDAPNPTRIWLDPAGRIDIVYDNRLVVLFPSGRLTPDMIRLFGEDESEDPAGVTP